MLGLHTNSQLTVTPWRKVTMLCSWLLHIHILAIVLTNKYTLTYKQITDSHYFCSQPQNLCPASIRYGTVREKCPLWQICQCKICMTCCLSNGVPSSLYQISGWLGSIIVSPVVQYVEYQLGCTDVDPGWHSLHSAHGRDYVCIFSTHLLEEIWFILSMFECCI